LAQDKRGASPCSPANATARNSRLAQQHKDSEDRTFFFQLPQSLSQLPRVIFVTNSFLSGLATAKHSFIQARTAVFTNSVELVGTVSDFRKNSVKVRKLRQELGHRVLLM
jgi:hypothetical protein